MTEIKFYESIDDALLKFAVIISKTSRVLYTLLVFYYTSYSLSDNIPHIPYDWRTVVSIPVTAFYPVYTIIFFVCIHYNNQHCTDNQRRKKQDKTFLVPKLFLSIFLE